MANSGKAPGEQRHGRPQRQKCRLSSSRQQLIELMQDINFGRLESLKVHGGEPVIDPGPLPKVVVRFPGENGPRPELSSPDFALKQQVIELFAYFDKLQNGVIESVEIQHGLPLKMIVSGLPGRRGAPDRLSG